MDLLSVLLHELGHVLGLAHGRSARYGDVMEPMLPAGTRRLLPVDAMSRAGRIRAPRDLVAGVVGRAPAAGPVSRIRARAAVAAGPAAVVAAVRPSSGTASGTPSSGLADALPAGWWPLAAVLLLVLWWWRRRAA
jgi:hypothetical protein